MAWTIRYSANEHSAGARVFLFTAANVQVPREGGLDNYGVQHNVIASTTTETGELKIEDTESNEDVYSIKKSDRYLRPNVPINADIYDNSDGNMVVTFMRRPSNYGVVIPNGRLEPSGTVRITIYDVSADSDGIILPVAIEDVEADTFTWTTEGEEKYTSLRVVVEGWDPTTSRFSEHSITLYHNR